MSKVFTRKKVRELALLMFDSGHLTLPEHETLLTEWLGQNAIGAEELLDSYQCLRDDYQALVVEKLLIEKELKSHQFTPEWADAPDWANWLAQDANGSWAWFDNKPQVREATFGCSNYGRFESLMIAINWKDTLQQRPRPTPQVEVGQVWKDESTKVKVGCLGRVSKNGEESIAFVDIDTNELKTWMLKTFIAKFERVR